MRVKGLHLPISETMHLHIPAISCSTGYQGASGWLEIQPVAYGHQTLRFRQNLRLGTADFQDMSLPPNGYLVFLREYVFGGENCP